jgi:hypothetical protein
MSAYTHIHVEIDLSKGLPDKTIPQWITFKYNQVLDYENTTFQCWMHQFQGHL